MAVTLESLVAALQSKAAITSDEVPFGATGFLNGVVSAALLEHNPSLSVASLPDNEAELVVLLAWIQVCLIRANLCAKDGNLTGASGYGQDRNTPYYKHIDFSKQLRLRYDQLYSAIVEGNTEGTITVSNLRVTSDTLDAVVPATPPQIVPVLYSSDQDEVNGTIVLHWVIAPTSNFSSFVILHMESETDSILQDWNIESTSGVPGTNNSAVLVATIIDSHRRVVKITGCDFTKVTRFVIGLKTYGGFYSFSNELILTPAVPDPPAP